RFAPVRDYDVVVPELELIPYARVHVRVDHLVPLGGHGSSDAHRGSVLAARARRLGLKRELAGRAPVSYREVTAIKRSVTGRRGLDDRRSRGRSVFPIQRLTGFHA